LEYNESSEMYLETIYILEKKHGHAHVADIARVLGVTKPSVSKAMNYLEKEKLINNESYQPVTLTEKGKSVSENIYRRHALIASFLEQSLGLSADEASENACRMEHSISEAMLSAIKKYLRNKT